MSRGVAVRVSLVHLRNREEERNVNADPHMRIMKRFRDFFNPDNREGHTLPKGSDGRKTYIEFHSKGDFFRDCSRLHTPL